MKSPFFQFFCSSCFSCHDCLCGIAPAARPAQHFQFDLVLSAYVWHSAHRDQAAGKETKLNVESNCQQKKGENSSFNAERMSYRHNLANPAQIWFVSRAAAHRFWLMPNQVPTGPLTPLGVCMRSVEGHEKKILSHFFYQKCNASERQISNYLKHCMPRNDSFGAKSHTAWRRSRAVLCAVPCATMQKHQTKCTASWIGTFLQPFQMDAAEKKQRWVVSSTVSSSSPWHFSQLAMFFFAIGQHQLSQLTIFFFRN